jgi:hypothetical protein
MSINSITEQTIERNDTRYPLVYVDTHGARWYYCSTARRYFQPATQPLRGKRGMLWIHCVHCDTFGLVKNRDPNYHEDAPQPHAYYVEETR